MISLKKLNISSVLILLFVVILTSCEKVIKLDLRTAPAKYVIEGDITNQSGPYRVHISKTIPFYNDNKYPGVVGATITIKDNTGFQEVLTDKGNGDYFTSQLIGKIGNTYFLTVKINDTIFTAHSTMPKLVPFDSLYVSDQNLYGKVQKIVIPVFKDPVGQGNNYFFNQYINGILDKTVYCDNDVFTDGQRIDEFLIRTDQDSTLHIGDHVLVEMQCIDKPIYDYWYSVGQSAIGNGNGIPSNPVSNIVGGALGYFSAHTSSKKQIVVEK